MPPTREQLDQQEKPDWFTLDELAERWRVSTETVRKWWLKQKLPRLPIGQRVHRIHRSVVEKLEQEAQHIEKQALSGGARDVRRLVAAMGHDNMPDIEG